MQKKITTFAATAILFGVCSISSADVVNPPGIYNGGPASPRLNMTDMRVTERAAYSLGEAFMQTTEAYVYAKGCQEFTVPITIYSHPDSADNFIQDNTFNGIKLIATLTGSVAGFGQHIDVEQQIAATLNGNAVQSLRGRYSYSGKNNMMVNERTSIQIKGQLRGYDNFSSSVIKDFYHGNTYDLFGDFYELYDYGLQSLSKYGYPVNKWWQKSKSVRDNGQQGCFVLQKDRLVGAGQCRITLSTVGVSQPGLFWQDGTLEVEAVNPNSPDLALDGCSVN